jgi:hypothetical protein
MRVRVGCLFEHDTAGDAAAVVMVDPHRSLGETVLEQEFSTAPPFEAGAFEDLYGNRCRRLVLPPGLSTFSYDAIVEVSPDNEEPRTSSTASRTCPTSCCTGSCPAATSSRTC